MFGESFNGWTTIVVVLMGIGYILIIQHLSKRASRPRTLNDAEMLATLALLGPHSEYDIFCQAAHEWHVPESRIDVDFKAYLQEGLIPYYVNSYTRKIGREIGSTYSPPFSLLGRGSLPWLK